MDNLLLVRLANSTIIFSRQANPVNDKSTDVGALSIYVGMDRQSSNLIIKDLAKIQELVTLVSSD